MLQNKRFFLTFQKYCGVFWLNLVLWIAANVTTILVMCESCW